jgi:hypothetical protein
MGTSPGGSRSTKLPGRAMATEAIQQRFTPEGIAAAAARFDAEDRATVGDVVMTLGEAALLLPLLAPREWEQLAAYLLALLDRQPVKSSPAYAGHRMILGALAYELRTYARIAGEPTGLEVDLRAATSQAEERRVRERIADHDLATDRMLDDIEAATAAQLRADDEEAWTRPSGDWLADAAAERDHERAHDHEEEAPAEPTARPAATEAWEGPSWMRPDAP